MSHKKSLRRKSIPCSNFSDIPLKDEESKKCNGMKKHKLDVSDIDKICKSPKTARGEQSSGKVTDGRKCKKQKIINSKEQKVSVYTHRKVNGYHSSHDTLPNQRATSISHEKQNFKQTKKGSRKLQACVRESSTKFSSACVSMGMSDSKQKCARNSKKIPYCGSEKMADRGHKRSGSSRRTKKTKIQSIDREPSLHKDKEGDSLEIPGFYYDREKKKYFRIQSSQFSKVNHTLTKETIQRKEREEKRVKDISKPVLEKRVNHKQNFPMCLNQRTSGELTPQQLIDFIKYSRLQNINLHPSKSRKITVTDKVEHCLSMQMNPNQKQILGLLSLKYTIVNRIDNINVVEQSISKEDTQLKVDFLTPREREKSIHVFDKVTSLCWVSISQEGTYDGVLHTKVSYTGDSDSLAVVRRIDAESGGQSFMYQHYNLGRKTAWCCGWNRHAGQFSIGSEKCALLIDSETRRMWELYTHKSDVLSQVFTSQSSHCIHNGTRSGHIVMHDLRSKSSAKYSHHLQMSSSVCGLRLLEDDIYLVASDVRGKVSLWDLRMRKSLIEYYGAKNSYSCIPIHVDEHSGVVYGADQEGYTRLWCLHTGQILRTVPPPVSTSIETIPSVLYSSQWCGRPGNSALVIGVEDKFYIYSA